MSWLGTLAGWTVFAVAGLAGWLVTSAIREPRARLAASVLGGVAVVWLGLFALDVTGVTWTRASIVGLLAVQWVVAAAVAVAVAVTVSRGSRRPGRTAATDSSLPRTSSPTRVDLVVASIVCAAAAVLAWAAATRLAVHPDFVFHWGVKGARHFLEGGIDVEYLAAPWNRHVHPDYPGLLPGLYAATGVLAGRFEVPAMLALAAPFVVVLLLGVDLLLVRLGTSAVGRVAGVAAVAGGVVAFSLGFPQLGGADLPLAAAATVGAAALVPALAPSRDDQPGRDLEIAAAATFAACVKIEGVALGGLLVVLHALRVGWRDGWRDGLVCSLRAGALPLVAVVAWAVWTRHHGLFLETNTGDFRLDRLAVVVPEMLRAATVRAWHGLPLALVALPVLVLWRRTRVAATLLLAQLGFYVVVYLAAPVDTRLYVATSASRLYLHLLPATLALVVAALDRSTQSSPSSTPRVKPSFLP